MTKTTTRIFTTVQLAALVLVLVAGATTASAQDREGRWEFTLGTLYQLGTSIDAESGGRVETDDDFGLSVGAGYNFTDKLATSFGMQWAGIGYGADVFDEDGNPFRVSGSYDTWALSGNVVFNLMDGPLTPYVGAGIGWTWVDTNVPSGLPSTVCWWDPWWGYVCYTDYPTKTTDAFSYQATVGLRYTFDNDMTFLRFGYTSQWQEFESADGTPRFDVIGLEVGWMF
jgi:opacity protein-like surface antigen